MYLIITGTITVTTILITTIVLGAIDKIITCGTPKAGHHITTTLSVAVVVAALSVEAVRLEAAVAEAVEAASGAVDKLIDKYLPKNPEL